MYSYAWAILLLPLLGCGVPSSPKRRGERRRSAWASSGGLVVALVVLGYRLAHEPPASPPSSPRSTSSPWRRTRARPRSSPPPTRWRWASTSQPERQLHGPDPLPRPRGAGSRDLDAAARRRLPALLLGDLAFASAMIEDGGEPRALPGVADPGRHVRDHPRAGPPLVAPAGPGRRPVGLRCSSVPTSPPARHGLPRGQAGLVHRSRDDPSTGALDMTDFRLLDPAWDAAARWTVTGLGYRSLVILGGPARGRRPGARRPAPVHRLAHGAARGPASGARRDRGRPRCSRAWCCWRACTTCSWSPTHVLSVVAVHRCGRRRVAERLPALALATLPGGAAVR